LTCTGWKQHRSGNQKNVVMFLRCYVFKEKNENKICMFYARVIRDNKVRYKELCVYQGNARVGSSEV